MEKIGGLDEAPLILKRVAGRLDVRRMSTSIYERCRDDQAHGRLTDKALLLLAFDGRQRAKNG
jgi:hypothetical protein